MPPSSVGKCMAAFVSQSRQARSCRVLTGLYRDLILRVFRSLTPNRRLRDPSLLMRTSVRKRGRKADSCLSNPQSFRPARPSAARPATEKSPDEILPCWRGRLARAASSTSWAAITAPCAAASANTALVCYGLAMLLKGSGNRPLRRMISHEENAQTMARRRHERASIL